MKSNVAIGVVLVFGLSVSAHAQPGGRSAPSTQVASTFTPGGEEIFALDFANARLGPFRGSEVAQPSGAVEVVMQDGKRMLRATKETELVIRLPRVLRPSEGFTIEVDIVPKDCCQPPDLSLEGTPRLDQDRNSAHLRWLADAAHGSIYVIGGAPENQEYELPGFIRQGLPGTLTRVGVSIDANTIRMYNNGEDVRAEEAGKAGEPIKAHFARTQYLRVSLGGLTDEMTGEVKPVYLARIRVAAGAPVVANAPGIPDRSQPTRDASAPVPIAIANLTVTDSPSGPVVNWLGVSSAVYTVQRWLLTDPKCCSNTSPASPPVTSPPWQDSPLSVPGTYVYKVTATTTSVATSAETTYDYAPAGSRPITERIETPTDRVSSLTVTVTPSANGPVVTWPSLPNATAYAVGRFKIDDPNCCNNSSGRGYGATSPWQDQPLPMSGTYVYRVAALTAAGEVVGETQFGFRMPEPAPNTMLPVAPATPTLTPTPALEPAPGVRPGSVSVAPAPTNLTATGNPVSVMLQWDPVPGATRYSVSRAVSGTTDWVTLPAPAAGATSTQPAYADGIPNPNDTYTYRVSAYQASGGVGTSSVDFKPPSPTDPTGFTATVTGPGTVRFQWNPVPDVAGYLISGPGTGTGITAALKLDASHRSSYTLTSIPAGTHTWAIASNWQPGGVLTRNTAWPKATATVGGAIGVRYRLVALGFKVDRQSKDINDARDGHGDEVYFTAVVNRTALTRVPLTATKEANLTYVMTRTHGDEAVSVPYGRIRAGTASATGGIKTGDVVPSTLDLTGTTSPLQANQFPILLWEGILDENAAVIVHPALWEDDVDPRVQALWARLITEEASQGYPTLGSSTSAGLLVGTRNYLTGQRIIEYSGGGTLGPRIFDDNSDLSPYPFAGSVLFACSTILINITFRPCEAHGMDRPIGLLGGGTPGIWYDPVIALTKAGVESSLMVRPDPFSPNKNTDPLGQGTFVVWLHDDVGEPSVTEAVARYKLYLRLERVP